MGKQTEKPKPNLETDRTVKEITWIDLTDFNKWSGTLTGIQRVIYNLCIFYSKQNNIKFFTYSKAGIFTESDFHIKDVYKQPVDNKLSMPGAVTLTTRIRSKLKRELIITLKLLGSFVPGRYKKYIKQKAIRLRNLIRKYKLSREKLADPKVVHHPFNTGDTVLILGASWAFEEARMLTDIHTIKTDAQIKVVNLVYDMIPVLFPQYFGPGFGAFFTKHMLDTASVSDGILAISESTKKDFIEFQNDWSLPEIPVEVIRLGDDINAKAAPKKLSVNQPGMPALKKGNYILTVGTVEIRKNHLLLYSTWKEAIRNNIDIPFLVIVGRPGWLTHDLIYQIENDPVSKGKIIILTNVKDEDLSWLYTNCKFTIYPSFYEGWGLPIAESLSYGKLCLASETSSMQEIAGDMLDYFNPYSVDNLIQLIKIYTNESALLKKEQTIRKKYRPQTWQKTFHDSEDALRNIENSLSKLEDFTKL